ncbi:MAG: tRNA (adenosine(37)-N6)-threonylcarbamoyltransferase complex dimerization subunit type 1 TsaB, partial [Rhizobiaceae bacterium]
GTMLLAIESSDRLCGACLLDTGNGSIVASKTIDIGKGHAELLMGVIDEVLAQAQAVYADLTSVAVCVGPGSFTGIRVGVSAAIGFGVALNIPVIGVTSLQALAVDAQSAGREALCLIDAHRGDVYAQSFSAQGTPLDAARQIALGEIAVMPSLQSKLLCGSGVAALKAAHPELDVQSFSGSPLPTVEGVARASQSLEMRVAAKPLYLRRPDAKPQESYTLARALR